MALVCSEPEDGSGLVTLGCVGAAVEGCADGVEDGVDRAETVDGVIVALLLVEVAQGAGLGVVDLETLVDGVEIVIAASAFLATVEESCDKFVIGDLKTHYSMEFRAALLKHLVEGVSLRDCTGKTVKDHAVFSLRIAVKDIGEDVDHQRIRDKIALGNVAVSHLAKLGTLGNVFT